MKSSSRAVFLALLLGTGGLPMLGCGGGQSSSSGSSCTTAQGSVAIPTSSTPDVPVYVADPSTTGTYGYFNEPLVSVTICSPNHTSSSQCQTISNVLLDTGSFGLRVFGSAVSSNVSLAQQNISVEGESMNLAECAIFGIGADWGPVKNGDVMLGNQTATNIPIHVIDSAFGSMPSGCAAFGVDTDPCTAGFNGILGVGLFAQDCGTACTSNDDATNPGIYFGCDSTGCFDGTQGSCSSDGACSFQIPLSSQVTNPVAFFSSGANNGISLSMPSVGASGSAAITGGILHLGIPTTSGVTVFLADGAGLADGNGSDFTTIFGVKTFGGSSSDPTNTTDPNLAFLDSGSNTLSFDDTGITQCSDSQGFFCPGSATPLMATIAGFSGSPTAVINFQIGNSDSLLNNGNTAFNNVGTYGKGLFDWGLPFFFNRKVYVGLSGQAATIDFSTSTGPFWAF